VGGHQYPPGSNAYTKGSGLVPWPKRLTTPPPQLEDINVGEGELKKDTILHLDSIVVISSLFSLLEEFYIGNYMFIFTYNLAYEITTSNS
jgi:hypothetical protein